MPRPEHDDARDRPAFAAGFPRVPAVEALLEAFQRGDYGYVRAEAARLANTSDDEAVRKAASELRARTGADPLAVGLLVLAAALLLAISSWWIVHGHTAPPAPERGREHVQ
jgi:hypothetical protein